MAFWPSTPAATSGESSWLLLDPPPCSSWLGASRVPMLLMVFCPKLFHCTPSARLAWREASTKRTSSITCWAAATDTVLIGSGANWRAMTTARSRVAASRAVPESMMRPLIDVTLMPPSLKWAISVASRVTS